MTLEVMHWHEKLAPESGVHGANLWSRFLDDDDGDDDVQ